MHRHHVALAEVLYGVNKKRRLLCTTLQFTIAKAKPQGTPRFSGGDLEAVEGGSLLCKVYLYLATNIKHGNGQRQKLMLLGGFECLLGNHQCGIKRDGL